MRVLHALAAVILFLSVAHALSSGTAITKNTVLDGGTYRLYNPGGTDAALLISTNNVVLDCNGTTIIGDGRGYGIEIRNAKNVVVKNCVVIGYSVGIRASSSERNTIRDNIVQDQTYGIYVNANHTQILRNRISLSSEAQIYAAEGLKNLTIKDNKDDVCSTFLVPEPVPVRPISQQGSADAAMRQVQLPQEEALVSACPYGQKREKLVGDARAVASLPGAGLGSAGAVLAPNGMVYVFGGANVSGSGSDVSNRILRYNTSKPTTDATATGAKLATAVYYITESAQINDRTGMAYIFGGDIDGFNDTAAIQRFDTNRPGSDAVSVASLPYGSAEGIGTVVNSTGHVLGYGHWNKSNSGSFYDSIFKYDTNDDTKDAADTGATLPAKGDGLACAILPNEKSYCAGATVSFGPYTREVYEHNTATPSRDAKTVSYLLAGHNVSHAAAVTSSNGKVYIIGGTVESGATNRPTTAIQEWNPNSPDRNTTVVAHLETAVYGAPAVIKKGIVSGDRIIDEVYVFGGWVDSGGTITAKIQRFNITVGVIAKPRTLEDEYKSGVPSLVLGQLTKIPEKYYDPPRYGIYLGAVESSTVYGNAFVFASNSGIMLYRSNRNTVENNRLLKNTFGISLLWSGNNTVTRNWLTDNAYGIALNHSGDNNISDNHVNMNNRGILAYFSSFNILRGNDLKNNLYGAELLYSTNNTITGNDLQNSGAAGARIEIEGTFMDIYNDTADTTNTWASNLWDGQSIRSGMPAPPIQETIVSSNGVTYTRTVRAIDTPVRRPVVDLPPIDVAPQIVRYEPPAYLPNPSVQPARDAIEPRMPSIPLQPVQAQPPSIRPIVAEPVPVLSNPVTPAPSAATARISANTITVPTVISRPLSAPRRALP